MSWQRHTARKQISMRRYEDGKDSLIDLRRSHGSWEINRRRYTQTRVSPRRQGEGGKSYALGIQKKVGEFNINEMPSGE